MCGNGNLSYEYSEVPARLLQQDEHFNAAEAAAPTKYVLPILQTPLLQSC